MLSFREYLDRFFPHKTASEIPDSNERNQVNIEIEVARNTKLLNFTKPGNPGTKFKSPFEKMMKALTIPKTVKEELQI